MEFWIKLLSKVLLKEKFFYDKYLYNFGLRLKIGIEKI